MFHITRSMNNQVDAKLKQVSSYLIKITVSRVEMYTVILAYIHISERNLDMKKRC